MVCIHRPSADNRQPPLIHVAPCRRYHFECVGYLPALRPKGQKRKLTDDGAEAYRCIACSEARGQPYRYRWDTPISRRLPKMRKGGRKAKAAVPAPPPPEEDPAVEEVETEEMIAAPEGEEVQLGDVVASDRMAFV
jgi:hypothetical protein